MPTIPTENIDDEGAIDVDTLETIADTVLEAVELEPDVEHAILSGMVFGAALVNLVADTAVDVDG